MALGWRDPSEWHWGPGAALARSLEWTCLYLKDPRHRRKSELCFQSECRAHGQHAREWEMNFASLCKGLNNKKKKAVSPFKGINRMKALLQPGVVSLHEAALCSGCTIRIVLQGGFYSPLKNTNFLLNINGSLTWSQLEPQSSAYNNDLCIKCSWSVIFIILMCFWCSVLIRTAAKWHQNQLWTCACVHALTNTTHVWCFSQGSE